MKIKTIDINALEWFDRVNGNSYFAAKVVLNFGLKDAKEITLPFQYGYGSHYIDQSKLEIEKQGFIKLDHSANGSSPALWRYCEENKIILRYTKHENCKKRELMNI